MARIFAYIVHKAGVVDDSAAELAAAASKIDAAASPTAVVVGSGPQLDAVCETLRSSYREIWKVANPAIAYPNAELIRKALVNVIPGGSIVLVPHSHFGIDLAPGLSIKLNAAFVSDVVAIEGTRVTRSSWSGRSSADRLAHTFAATFLQARSLSTRPGAFKPLEGAPLSGAVVDKSAEVGALTAGRRYLETVVAEAGDVDITKYGVLVSVGRGIQEKDNIPIADELAEALGAAVSCSRPVVDAKWLPKSRQVGSSGQTVKPKVYMACGISGSFQHLAGLKGNPFIVAINKNPKAPIFQVADVGIVADILEFLPELTTKVREAKGASV